MITVLIADNQTLTREGAITVLSAAKDIRIVGQATTLPELKQMVVNLQPDVVLMDTHYDTHITLDSLKLIQQQFEFNNFLILSNRQHRNEILEVLQQGIKNYVSKECKPEEIIKAVYATARGEKFFCERTLQLLWGNQLATSRIDEIPSLSARETEIVTMIADGKTNKEIAENLFLSVHTIKTHRKNIIKKLGFTFKNATELIPIISSLNSLFI